MKRAAGIIGIIAGLIMLSGCGSDTGGIDSNGVISTGEGFSASRVRSFYVDTIDNRRIPCVYIGAGYGAGLSCDWNSNAN